MSLTRKALTAMGIEGEKVDQIIEMHSETVNSLKDQIAEYKEKASKLPEISKELDELKLSAQNPDEYKEKYESEKQAFEDFKKQLEIEKANSTKDKLYRQLLSENHVKSNKIDLIMRTVNLDKLELDGDKLKDSADLNKAIMNDWADFIETTEVKGTDTATPPNGAENAVDYGNQIQKFREALGLPPEK
jgi:ribosomal protein L20A (L18A)